MYLDSYVNWFNASTSVVRVTLTVTFSNGVVREDIQDVQPSSAWGVRLADVFTLQEQAEWAMSRPLLNARAEVRCGVDGSIACPLTVANWYRPLPAPLGTQPSIYLPQPQCRP